LQIRRQYPGKFKQKTPPIHRFRKLSEIMRHGKGRAPQILKWRGEFFLQKFKRF